MEGMGRGELWAAAIPQGLGEWFEEKEEELAGLCPEALVADMP